MVAGIVRVRRGDRLTGYRLLDRALLVQVFITQVFVFVESSFGAITGLLVAIALLITVRLLQRREQERQEARPASPAAAAVAAEQAVA